MRNLDITKKLLCEKNVGKNTCTISKKGVYAAYVRARQYHRRNITAKADRMLRLR